ncbi:MAG TPA: hypothetical protein VF746_25995 [Longimicrobium sp.]
MELIIRDEQLRVLGEAARERFVRGALEKLRKHWPGAFRELGEAAARARVERAVAEAEGFGIRAEADVLRFVNLAFALGDGFAADPRRPWARALLADTALTPTERLDRLVELALDELDGGGP